jgi:hypothetical protein
MGRVRVANLNFAIDMLRREVDTFRKLTEDASWMTQDNQERRKALTEGLTFIMLNLDSGVDQDVAWGLYHEAMDEYHEVCDERRLRY